MSADPVLAMGRRRSLAALWSKRMAVFALMLGLVGTTSHRFDLLDTIAYFWVLGIVVALAFLALVLAVIGFTRLWEFGDKGGRASLVGSLLALLVLLPFGYGAALLLIHPRLNDISTDVQDPPALVEAARLRTGAMNSIMPFTAENGALQEESYPEVVGRRYAFTADRTVDGVVTAAGQAGWKIVDNPGWEDGEQSVTLQLVARSFLLGFPSDMAVRVTDEGESSYVDVRSASRYGLHDLGSNAARIEDLLGRLDKVMAGVTGLETTE
jgi:hypothetical protein